ncbi:MAG: putative zinc-binding protein [Planctomycetota bacterium]|jgi:uncharacterized metal-binding protein
MADADKCCGGTRLIFACSGAADVGEIADRAARKLAREGVARMFCLAGLGGDVSGIVESTKGADVVLALDGCSVACARKGLVRVGISGFAHVMATDCGLEKGKSPVTDEAVAKVAAAGAGALA